MKLNMAQFRMLSDNREIRLRRYGQEYSYSSEDGIFRISYNSNDKIWEFFYKNELIEKSMTFGEISLRHGFVTF